MSSRRLTDTPRPPDRRRETARPRRYRLDPGVALERRLLPAVMAPLPGSVIAPGAAATADKAAPPGDLSLSATTAAVVVAANPAAAGPGSQDLGVLSAAEVRGGVTLTRQGTAMPHDTGESYRFEVSGTEYYSLGINGSAVMPASPLSVSDARGRALSAEDLGDNGIGLTLSPGTYTLRVGSWPAGFSSLLSYQITLTTGPDPDAPARSPGGPAEASGAHPGWGATASTGSGESDGGLAAAGRGGAGAVSAASATALALGHASGDLVALAVGPVGGVGPANPAGQAGQAVTQLNLTPTSTPGQALVRMLTTTQVLGVGDGEAPPPGVLGAADGGDPAVVFGVAMRQAADAPPPPPADAQAGDEAAAGRAAAPASPATAAVAVAVAVADGGPVADVLSWAEDPGPAPDAAPDPAGEAPVRTLRAEIGWAAGLTAAGAAALAHARKALSRRRRAADAGADDRPLPEARAGRAGLGAGAGAAAKPEPEAELKPGSEAGGVGGPATRRFWRHQGLAAGRRRRRVTT